MGVSWMFCECFNEVLRMLEVARVFHECFKSIEKEVSKIFQAGFKVVSGCFKGLSTRFQSFSKDVSRVFQKILRVSPGSLKVFLWCLREGSCAFFECFKVVLRVF